MAVRIASDDWTNENMMLEQALEGDPVAALQAYADDWLKAAQGELGKVTPDINGLLGLPDPEILTSNPVKILEVRPTEDGAEVDFTGGEILMGKETIEWSDHETVGELFGYWILNVIAENATNTAWYGDREQYSEELNELPGRAPKKKDEPS